MRNIILDLDSTLIHTQENMEDFKSLKLYSSTENSHLRKYFYLIDLIDVEPAQPGTGNFLRLCGVYRPHLKNFIKFCFKNFDNVFVWSAGRKKYVHQLAGYIFEGYKPSEILTYEDCLIKNQVIHKPIDLLINSEKWKGKVTLENTIIVDDREDIFDLNKRNGILIPPFTIKLSRDNLEDMKDNYLEVLIKYFSTKEFKEARDIRELDFSKIFTDK